MPVPWEALVPFALVTTMFGAAGTLFKVSKTHQNNGLYPRYSLDDWDEMMMDRDRRLTGHFRGISTEPSAPESFTTNSAWYTQKAS
ncbi:unnamed protein product [Peniophora sp. CBMAI 1063]|nr:unnamed protein product [Peniophora sp. CBMAI 1063]